MKFIIFELFKVCKNLISWFFGVYKRAKKLNSYFWGVLSLQKKSLCFSSFFKFAKNWFRLSGKVPSFCCKKHPESTKCLILCKGWYLSFEENFFKKKVLRTWGKTMRFFHLRYFSTFSKIR